MTEEHPRIAKLRESWARVRRTRKKRDADAAFVRPVPRSVLDDEPEERLQPSIDTCEAGVGDLDGMTTTDLGQVRR